MKIKWVLALLPAAAGTTIDALSQLGAMADPALYLRGDRGTLALLAGILLSGLTLGGLLLDAWAERRCQRRLGGLRDEAAAERRRFLQRLDHELKNPLMGIRAALVNVPNGATTPAQQAALDSIEQQAIRLGRLTADLRKLAELETRSLECTPVDIAALLQEAFSLAQEQTAAPARQLSLVLPKIPWPVPAISGDRDLLLAAIYNLLDNALKFTQPGDSIEVRAHQAGSAVYVEVADNGPGIPAEDLPHLGKELYRGQAAHGLPGSGLGLALARAVVERHGGQLAVASRVGEGTVVTVKLPLK